MAVSGVLQQEVTFMVQHGGRVGLDGIEVSFDDERAVANAPMPFTLPALSRLPAWLLPGRCGPPTIAVGLTTSRCG